MPCPISPLPGAADKGVGIRWSSSRDKRGDMVLELLEKRQGIILEEWRALMRSSYPPETAVLLGRDPDRFLNPVGHAVTRETGTILRGLLAGEDVRALADSIDGLVKIHAVQALPPSQAVGFIFLLKKAIKKALGDAASAAEMAREIAKLESRLDDAALLAFDLYMRRRERVHEIRARELRERSDRILERLSRIYGPVDQGLEGLGFGASDEGRGDGT